MQAGFDAFLLHACPPLDLAWRKYRRRAARRHVNERMRSLGLRTYAAYLERLRVDPAEAAGLADIMCVTVSRFLRDRQRWLPLARRVIPELIRAHPRGAPVRAWSVGCCNGEEPYSLAIVWLEHARPSWPEARLEIIATDIDEVALERARRGAYANGSLREVAPERRERWFVRRGGMWWVDERLRRLVAFERGNLMTDPPPQDMDLVLCRYLAFTYYEGERRRRAVERLHRALRPGGALMIGAKEHLDAGALERFDPWPGVEGVYRKRESPRDGRNCKPCDVGCGSTSPRGRGADRSSTPPGARRPRLFVRQADRLTRAVSSPPPRVSCRRRRGEGA
jgi:chemotaxis methyl-accepting protein methylase